MLTFLYNIRTAETNSLFYCEALMGDMEAVRMTKHEPRHHVTQQQTLQQKVLQQKVPQQKNEHPSPQQNWGHEIQRLKQDHATRQCADRPLTHSIEVAYRQVIATYERNKRATDQLD